MRKFTLIPKKCGNRLAASATRCSNLFCTVFVIALSTIPVFAFQSRDEQITVVDGSDFLDEIAALPKQIREASGLELINGNLWTHNDGGVPMLYCLDSLGNLVRTLQLNHKNSGWEDLTRDDAGNLYVGAFGNNKNDKRPLKIYKIPDPTALPVPPVLTGEIIEFEYEDQTEFPPPESERNFDADAFIAFDDSLYIFTKNRTNPFTGYTNVYRLPQEAGKYKAIKSDSIFLGKGSMLDNWVTAACLSPDRNTLALLSHQCLWLITDFRENKFSQGKITRINLGHFSHKAGMTFSHSGKLYIVDELEFNLIGGKLYSLDLSKMPGNPQ